VTIYDRMHPFRTHEVCKKYVFVRLGVSVSCVSLCVCLFVDRAHCTVRSYMVTNAIKST